MHYAMQLLSLNRTRVSMLKCLLDMLGNLLNLLNLVIITLSIKILFHIVELRLATL